MKTRMMEPLNCAQAIIQQALNNHCRINPVQLQQNLFLLTAQYQTQTQHYPFDSSIRFQPWCYSPTLPEVKAQYRNYGNMPIKSSIITTFDYSQYVFQHHACDLTKLDPIFIQLCHTLVKPLLSVNYFRITSYVHDQPYWQQHNCDEKPYPPEIVRFQNVDQLTNLINNQFAI